MVNFSNVKIGRTSPQSSSSARVQEKPGDIKASSDSGPFSMKEMQNTEGCSTPPSYTLDANAAKFGDKKHSHVLHYLKDSFWKKDFAIELSFRTFYSEGTLFLSHVS